MTTEQRQHTAQQQNAQFWADELYTKVYELGLEGNEYYSINDLPNIKAVLESLLTTSTQDDIIAVKCSSYDAKQETYFYMALEHSLLEDVDFHFDSETSGTFADFVNEGLRTYEVEREFKSFGLLWMKDHINELKIFVG